MKTLHYILFVFFVMGCAACQTKKAPKPAHIRVLSMVQYASATLSIKGKGNREHIQKKLSLDYEKSSGYQQLPPGYYEITLRVKGKALLKRIYALGKNGYYTLLATGLLPEKWKVNPRTSLFHIKYIFAGAELESANAYLPQWIMMRDNYDGNKKNAYVRFVNANPHTPALSVKRNTENLENKLAYPTKSEMIKLSPGSQPFEFYYGRVKLGNKKLSTKSGYIYTVIVGNKETSRDKLQISILKNPSRTLLRSE